MPIPDITTQLKLIEADCVTPFPRNRTIREARETITSMEAEIARLRVECNALQKICAERSDENERLRAALTPFADLALWRDTYPDGPDILSSSEMMSQYITPAMVRAARDAIGAHEQTAIEK